MLTLLENEKPKSQKGGRKVGFSYNSSKLGGNFTELFAKVKNISYGKLKTII